MPRGAFPAALVMALFIATALQRWKAPPQPRFAGLYRWSSHRKLGQARARSVFGDVEVRLEDDAVVRVNAMGELRIPWANVMAVVHSPSLLTLVLTEGKVVGVPRRAFADDASAEAFRTEGERRSGKPAVNVPDQP